MSFNSVSSPFTALLSRWSDRLADAKCYAGDDTIKALDRCLVEAQQAHDAWLVMRLNTTTASEESGLAPSTLRRMIRKGAVQNCGTPGKPLVRRADLPVRSRSKPLAAASLNRSVCNAFSAVFIASKEVV